MRKIFLLLGLLASCTLSAQVARWVIHPDYDHIRLLGNGNYVVVKGGRYGMLNSQEQPTLKLEYDSISAFSSHKALLFKSGRCVGFVSDHGDTPVKISDQDFDIVGEKCFSCGYLPIRTSAGYYFVQAANGQQMGAYAGLAPFCEDYAWVKIPKSSKHVLDGSFTFDVLSAKNGHPVALSLGSEYDKEDIDFISSCSNGKSIIVLKRRFFEYDYKKGLLTPLATDDNPDNKKSRVTALERPVNVIAEASGYKIRFKQGMMRFDNLMRLTSITYDGKGTKLVDVPQPAKVQHESLLQATAFSGTDLLGLAYGEKDVLPAQFDEVCDQWGNEALVRLNGKFGVLTVDADAQCRYVLNDNMNVGFEHSSVKTNIKVICPHYMDPRLMTLTSLSSGCTINTDTRSDKVNVETAVLSYDCTLKIPENIGVRLTPESLRLSLTYDDLKYMPATISFNTWYINQYDVRLLSHKISGSMLSAEVIVKYNGQRSANYYYDVKIVADSSVVCNYEEQNAELYTVRLYNWDSSTDAVKFSVNIKETGCPTLKYPFEIPVRNSSAPAKKAAVTTESASRPSKTTQNSRTTSNKKKKRDVILISPL